MEEWIGEVIGKMHVNKITQVELARHLGIRRDYLSKILNGAINPKGAKQRIVTAINEIINERG